MLALSLLIGSGPQYILKSECLCGDGGAARHADGEEQCVSPTPSDPCPNAKGKAATPLITAALLGLLALYCSFVVRERGRSETSAGDSEGGPRYVRRGSSSGTWAGRALVVVIAWHRARASDALPSDMPTRIAPQWLVSSFQPLALPDRALVQTRPVSDCCLWMKAARAGCSKTALGRAAGGVGWHTEINK